jgi:hypothetical protein
MNIGYVLPVIMLFMSLKKCLKIPKGQSESVYRRRKTRQWPKEKNIKGQATIYKTYI